MTLSRMRRRAPRPHPSVEECRPRSVFNCAVCENCRIGFLIITPKIFVVEQNQVHFRVQEIISHRITYVFMFKTYEKRKSIGDFKSSLSPKILILQQNEVHFRVQEIILLKNNVCVMLITYEKQNRSVI